MGSNIAGTILLDSAPVFEFKGGLLYITDVLDGVTVRRAMRPCTATESGKRFNRAMDGFHEDCGRVIPIR